MKLKLKKIKNKSKAIKRLVRKEFKLTKLARAASEAINS